MKISIEVDLEPHEFDLANELLRTISVLTEHVKFKKTGAIAQPPAADSAIVSALPKVPTPAPVTVPVPVPVQPVTPVPALVAPVTPAAAGPATPQDARRMFSELLSSLIQPNRLDPVAAEVARLFSSSSLPPTQLQDEFLEAFYAVTFDPKHIPADHGVAPFMHVLPRLPDPVKEAVKGKVIAKVLGHLNQKRPISTRREEFYLQADAFAVLSEMDFVGIDGAVQTIEKLLRNAEKRAAAITTLGKTVEKCRDKMAAANQAFVAKLFTVLDGITEENFKYDIEWINTNMQRTRPQQGVAAAPQALVGFPASAAGPSGATTLVPAASAVVAAAAPAAGQAVTPRAPASALLNTTNSFSNATLAANPNAGTYFTLGWDPKSQHLISGGREVPVTVWGTDGQVQHVIDCAGMYVCCIDVELQNQLVLMCGIFDPATTPYKSKIVVYDGRPGMSFADRGSILRQEVDMTAVVRALPGTPHMVSGESVREPSGVFRELISMYDLNRVMASSSSSGSSSVEPVTVFQDHKNLVTCLAPLPANPGVFVSGSRDFTVKLWDARVGPSALFTFGVAKGDFAATTHAEMVTCVDVAGDLVVSGSLDQSLAAWDLRSMGQPGVMRPVAVAGPTSAFMQSNGQPAAWVNHGILKASLEGSPYDKFVAAATVQGLYTVDFSAATPVITAAGAYGPDGTTPKQYNDIKWASGTGRLYASAGDGVMIDVLEMQAR